MRFAGRFIERRSRDHTCMGAASRDITQRCTHFYPISCYTRPKSDRNRPCQRTEIIGPTSAPHRRESCGTSDCALWPLLEVRGCGWRAKQVHCAIPKWARVARNLCFERSGRRGKRCLTLIVEHGSWRCARACCFLRNPNPNPNRSRTWTEPEDAADKYSRKLSCARAR